MKKGVKNVRKLRAALIAGAMAVAIVLTGTLAWQSISQETINEFVEDKNPGGRVHDDFKGTENKDVYAENFTDLAKGAHVFVRIRLEEYMEIGEDAGLKRDETTRKAESVAQSRKDPAQPADINDTDTWFIHKPDVADPFHEYWDWDQDGSTIYMPTFNKNKDSLSVDVNGTYVGPNKEFDDIDPYQDYVTYTDGQTKTGDAYYDTDDNVLDEYDPVTDPTDVPGAGGVLQDLTADPPVQGNYKAVEEEHTAKATLNGKGYITMADWIAGGMKVCNKWVWDEDGWFYWPEPIMPQTATGLLLDKVTERKSTSEKSYYAINIVGQFATEGDWGKAQETEKDEFGHEIVDSDGNPIVTVEAEGFYIDGITENALALLNQAASVKVGEDGKWYLPQGQNLFKEILDDDGNLGDLVCAGEDRAPGNTTDPDDRTDVVYAPDGITVGTTNYGNYFLEPRPAVPYEEPYYRGVGDDGLLGTADDSRLWLTSGSFPTGTFVDKIVDTVTITAPTGTTDKFTELEAGKGEMEVGSTTEAFSAASSLNGTPTTGDTLVWTVEAEDGKALKPGTTVSSTGVLTVDENETAKVLILTATSKLDNRYRAFYTVNVYGKLNVKIFASGGSATVQAGKTLNLKAQLCRGDEAAPTQPTFTWSVVKKPRLDVSTLSVNVNAGDSTLATLVTSRYNITNATVTATCTECATPGTLDITITAPEPITFSVTETTGKTSAEAGQTLTFKATPSKTGVLGNEEVTWKVYDATGAALTSGLTVTPNNADNTVTVKVLESFVLGANNGTIRLVADPNDGTGTDGEATFTITPPTGIKITPDPARVMLGRSIDMEAQLLNGTNNYASSEVTWSVAPKNPGDTLKSGTKIDATTGVLSADANETATELVVTATSVVQPSLSQTHSVAVMDGIPIEGDIVTYDGIEFIVLTRQPENDRMLILSKYVLSEGEKKFDDSTNVWNSSSLRAWLNSDTGDGWLNGKTELQAAIKNYAAGGTDIKTRSAYNAMGHITTKDRVFLLSEADCFGTFIQNPGDVQDDDYTAGGKFKWMDGGNWIAKPNASGSDVNWWLRSPNYRNSLCVISDTDGAGYSSTILNSYYVRPALWVKLTPPTT